MRVFLTSSPASGPHSGPRSMLRFVGLSSPVMMRRRMGYLSCSAIVDFSRIPGFKLLH